MTKEELCENRVRHEYHQALYSSINACAFGSKTEYMFLITTLNKMKPFCRDACVHVPDTVLMHHFYKAYNPMLVSKLESYRRLILCDIEDYLPYLKDEYSVLELLICFADNMDYEPSNYFWKFIENLGLSNFTDDVWNFKMDRKLSEVIYRWLSKKYKKNGEGSAFKLDSYSKDQRKLDILQQYDLYKKENL